MRFHACLFSIYANIPFLPIFSTRKITNLLKDISWNYAYKLPLNEIDLPTDINLNVYIITHSGVLYDYSNEGFVNNSGFVINTKNGTPINYFSLTNILPKEFFKDYRNTQYLIKPLFCNGRCGNLCNVMY